MIGIQRIDDKWFKSSHMLFEDDGPLKPGTKTRKFNVFGPTHSLLGRVEWYGAWRQYCFFPLDSKSVIFNKDCMRQLADFCELVTKEHKDKLPKVQWAKDRLKEQRKRRLEQIERKKLLTNKESTDSIDSEVKIVLS